MKYRTLGKTALKVSEVGFGAWAIGGNNYGNSYGPTDDKVSVAAVERAFELGCNFFDTADVYGHGHSEEILGQALKGPRNDVILATKVGGDFYHDPPRMNFSPEYLEFASAKSCERLQTDYIDLYQLHNPPIQLLKNGKIVEGLEKLKDSGVIRHYGVSIHDPQEGILSMKYGHPEAIQVVFNLLRQEAKNQLFQAARERNVGIIAREPLSNGFLSGKFTIDSTFPSGDIRSNFPRNYLSGLIGAAEQLRLLESKTRTLGSRESASHFRVGTDAVEFNIFADNEKELAERKSLLTESSFSIVSVRLLDTPPKAVDKAEALEEGIQLFNEERFWESHEALEQAWHIAKGVERDAIQSIILTAAAFVHYQKGEEEICLSIMKRARAKMSLVKGYEVIDFDSLERNINGILDSEKIQLFKLRISRF